MRENIPSKTALRVALRRAAHQLLDDAKVLEDPLAVQVVGDAAAEIRSNPGRHNSRIAKSFRAFLVARSRFAGDQLAEGIARGITQYLILGAGLDTSAYRLPATNSGIAIFEVDHPATQTWKLQRLNAAAIAIAENVHHVPLNFERQRMDEELAKAGFRIDRKTFVSWLGVVPYLTRETAASTLQFLGSLPPGSGVVFDYAVSKSSLGLVERIFLEALAWRVAKAGEPFRLFFEPSELEQFLRERGFCRIEQLAAREINERYFRNRPDNLRAAGGAGRIVAAWT
jgi:methyltransferase (TIGR00027 family)